MTDIDEPGVAQALALHQQGRLATDIARLESIRATLRDDLLSSPLGDAPRFVRNFEGALREMWRRWCLSQPEPTVP